VIFRLVETWRITPDATSHEVSILGEQLTYPAANLAAVVVVALAAVGLVVVARIAAGAMRELLADHRLRRALRAQETRDVWRHAGDRRRAPARLLRRSAA
jgi:hypothetical protein